MAGFRFTVPFVQFVLLPSVLLLSIAYFIMFANTRIPKTSKLAKTGKAIAAIILLVVMIVFVNGFFSIGTYSRMRHPGDRQTRQKDPRIMRQPQSAPMQQDMQGQNTPK